MTVFLLILMALIVTAVLASLLFFYFYAGRNGSMTRYTSDNAPKKYKSYIQQTEEMLAEIQGVNRQPLEITSVDGFKLRGNLYTMCPGTKNVVIALHGYHGGDVLDMGRFLPMYQRLGFDCLIPQMRCHGESEGQFITFGFREQYDGIAWCRKLEQIYGTDVRIILHGSSMGASTALMMCGSSRVPKSVKGCVADSAYDRMDAVAEWHLRRYPKWCRKVMVTSLNMWFNLLAHVDLHDISVPDRVSSATVPALFIHSVDDKTVPIKMYHANREAWPASAGGFTVTGVPHVNAYVKEPEEYEKRFRQLTELAMQD